MKKAFIFITATVLVTSCAITRNFFKLEQLYYDKEYRSKQVLPVATYYQTHPDLSSYSKRERINLGECFIKNDAKACHFMVDAITKYAQQSTKGPEAIEKLPAFYQVDLNTTSYQNQLGLHYIPYYTALCKLGEKDYCVKAMDSLYNQFDIHKLTLPQGYSIEKYKTQDLCVNNCSLVIDHVENYGQTELGDRTGYLNTLLEVSQIACDAGYGRACYTNEIAKNKYEDIIHDNKEIFKDQEPNYKENFEKACKLGYPRACFELAHDLRKEDTNIASNYKKAFTLLKKGGSIGDKKSCADLNSLYFDKKTPQYIKNKIKTIYQKYTHKSLKRVEDEFVPHIPTAAEIQREAEYNQWLQNKWEEENRKYDNMPDSLNLNVGGNEVKCYKNNRGGFDCD